MPATTYESDIDQANATIVANRVFIVGQEIAAKQTRAGAQLALAAILRLLLSGRSGELVGIRQKARAWHGSTCITLRYHDKRLG